MKKILTITALIILNFLSFGQNLSNVVEKDLIISRDTLRIDTLSIVPGTFIFSFNNKTISDTAYFIDYAKSLLTLHPELYADLKNKICKITYRRFPLNFMQDYKHKNFISGNNNIKRHYKHISAENDKNNDKIFSGLKKSGSISRGIIFGNNQNSSLNSDFNLQLSGKINSETEISANITDSNIPIQADGSSQNLREFDKVFIRLNTKKSILEVGDLTIQPNEGYFLKFNKKIKGVGFTTDFNTGKNISVSTKFNTAVSKGTYNKMSFTGTEGNQGPYRLTGKNGEMYIIILSGSEKIYLDGKLLKRGNEYDYVINYNSGELTFTANRIITKDSRIIAEFEYSEMNYVRFSLANSTIIRTKNTNIFLNLISEQDAKNRGITQELSDEQKLMFYNIGDNIQQAFVSGAVLLDTFNRNEVLYKKNDTIVQSSYYQNIYAYSTDSLQAKYRVNFSFIGAGKGNYKRIKNGANGKVYQWVAPVNGIPQGDYEPLRLLISPKKKQMINAGVFGKINQSTKYYVEGAFSNNDINTFSEIGDDDNPGYAFKIVGTKNFLTKDTVDAYLKLTANYRFTDKQFDAFEPYKTLEFNRDWNLLPSETLFDEHFATLNLVWFNQKSGKAGLTSELLLRNRFYKGNKEGVFVNIDKKKLSVDIKANRLITSDTTKQSEFIRYFARVESKFSHFNIGIRNSGEKNIFSSSIDTLANLSSFRFNEFETFLKTPEKSKHLLSLSYLNREDFLPFKNDVTYASTAHNLKFKATLLNLKNQTINTSLNFRKLTVKDSLLLNTPTENTLSGRLNHSFKLFHGAVSGSSFFEHTSGNEAIKEFSYLEVQNGQGIFAWKDFNNNQIKELNEFVRANFADEANYIRITLPSNKYQQVYNQSVYEVFNLIPQRIWHSKKGLKKVLSLFSNRLSYKLNRKINNRSNYLSISIPDSVMISKNNSLKNRFTISIPKFKTQFNYTFINSETKNLLINGFDTRTNMFHNFELNKKIQDIIFANIFKSGNKKYISEFFSDNNYSINYTENETSVNYKIDEKSTVKTNFIIRKKNNLIGEENLNSYTAGGEYLFSSINKGRFQINFNFVNIKYTGTSNTAISYEILEGLQNGKNFLWTVQWYKKITNSLQLELNYSGRKTDGNKIIHTGGMSLRAFF